MTTPAVGMLQNTLHHWSSTEDNTTYIVPMSSERSSHPVTLDVFHQGTILKCPFMDIPLIDQPLFLGSAAVQLETSGYRLPDQSIMAYRHFTVINEVGVTQSALELFGKICLMAIEMEPIPDFIVANINTDDTNINYIVWYHFQPLKSERSRERDE